MQYLFFLSFFFFALLERWWQYDAKAETLDNEFNATYFLLLFLLLLFYYMSSSFLPLK